MDRNVRNANGQGHENLLAADRPAGDPDYGGRSIAAAVWWTRTCVRDEAFGI